MKRYFLLALIAVTLLACSCGIGGTATPTATPASTPTPSPTLTPTPTPAYKTYSEPPPMIIDTTKHYTAIIETEKGNLVLELFAADVPITVNNFVFLANDGFYDNCTFHRVIPGFVAQGGDPTGTGYGTPGYYIPNEITEHNHVAGAISMANSGPDRNGCQFFICYDTLPQLDGNYSVFGQLIEGMDVLESLTPRDPAQNPYFEGDTIVRITIEES